MNKAESNRTGHPASAKILICVYVVHTPHPPTHPPHTERERERVSGRQRESQTDRHGGGGGVSPQNEEYGIRKELAF